MNVFVPAVDEGFEWVRPSDDRDFETLRDLGHSPVADAWTPIAVQLLTTDDDGKPRNRADLPWLGSHLLVLRRDAAESLRKLLQRVGELLPLSCSAADLVLFHSTVLIDALDEDRCELVRFSSGRIMHIERHAFREAAIEGALIFQVPQMSRGSLYATGAFVSVYEQLGYTGTTFGRVW